MSGFLFILKEEILADSQKKIFGGNLNLADGRKNLIWRMTKKSNIKTRNRYFPF